MLSQNQEEEQVEAVMMTTQKSQQKLMSHPTLEHIYGQIEAIENSKVIEAIRELGDGMQAKIYLARDHHNRQICVKVFKQGLDTSLMNNAEEEYKVSQLLGGCPNIVKIFAFER